MVWFQEESVSEQGDKLYSFTVVNPMGNQDDFWESLCDFVTIKNRDIQKYLETLSGYSIFVQFEARSTKRTANLLDKIKRSYSLRHTACRVHWESDLHEDQGSALSKGKRDSKTACCSWSKFAKWITRSTLTKSKIILGIATRCGELRGNPKQHCWLQNTWYIVLNVETAGCTTTKERHKADRDVRETSA